MAKSGGGLRSLKALELEKQGGGGSSLAALQKFTPMLLPYQVAKMLEVVCETISSSFDHLTCNFIDSRTLVVLHSR